MTTAAAPQHMVALGTANRIRLGRAALKRRIRAGEVSVADVLREPPECMQTITMAELLRSQSRWGVTRTRRLLTKAGMVEQRQVGMLTARQVRVLVDLLEAPCAAAD